MSRATNEVGWEYKQAEVGESGDADANKCIMQGEEGNFMHLKVEQ